ncbi:MAG: DUF1735 domain-containing protein [Flavisolibacter sp.]
MNTRIFKKLIFSAPAFLLILLSGCLKTHDGYVDLSNTSDFVILTGAGTGNFKASNVLVNTSSPDTLRKTITVDLASKNNDNGPVVVTLGFDAAALAAYNSANGTSFQPFPANAYKIVNPKVTIPLGQHYGTATVEIYQNKLDPTVSYMLPISITDGGGKQISSNENTIYYNVIGNPLAGVYTFTGSRWNAPNTDTTKPPASIPYNNVSIAVGPINATTLFLPDAYLSQNGVPAGTALSFTNTAGVLSNIKASLSDPQGGIAAVGFSVVSGPVLVGYNIAGTAASHYVGSTFRIYYVFFNGSANRAIIDNFVKTQ